MKKVKTKGCGGTKAGSFHHVHNQGGGGSFSASVSLAILSLNYTSGEPDLELTKSSKYNYYN